MVELVKVDSTDLTENAVVTEFSQISDNIYSFFSEPSQERIFFLKEGFNTFGGLCDYEETSFQYCITSQTSSVNSYVWVLFNLQNLGFSCLGTNRRSSGNHAIIDQNFHVELQNGFDMGYFQMICLPTQAYCDGTVHSQYDIITFYVYADMAAKDKYPFPSLVTLRPTSLQTYIPLFPRQSIQIVTSYDEQMEFVTNSILNKVNSSDRLFSLGVNKVEQLQATTYICESIPKKIEPIFITGSLEKAILFPPITKEFDGVYITMSKPVKEAVVCTEYIDGIHLISAEIENWCGDDNCLTLEETINGLDIRLKKKINSLRIVFENDVWWIMENVDSLVGEI